MANVKLVFSGSERSLTNNYQLECFWNARNEITLMIDDGYSEKITICLDKSTAIKFHKELKKQISFIEPEKDNNDE